MLRTKARDACARGPSLPSMLTGSPITTAATASASNRVEQLGRVVTEFPRRRYRTRMGEAKARSATAMPDRLVAEVEPASVRPPVSQARHRLDVTITADARPPFDLPGLAFYFLRRRRKAEVRNAPMKITWYGHSAFRIETAAARTS